MGIELDKVNRATIATCDTCSFTIQTEVADGALPLDWLPGRLILDIALNEQINMPICFCPECHLDILSASKIVIEGQSDEMPVEELVEDEPELPLEEPDI